MGQHKIFIVLDDSNGTCVSQNFATKISGKVVIVSREAQLVAGVMLYFKGHAEVAWNEVQSKRTVNYYGKEALVDESLRLLGQKDACNRYPLNRDKHSFPFVLTLPPDLPASCKEKHGRIEYLLEVVIERMPIRELWRPPQGMPEFKTQRVLNVVAPLQLAMADVTLAVRSSAEKTFRCGWVCSGLMTLALSLPARSVVIGQPFPVSVEIYNASRIDVRAVVGRVRKYTTYRQLPPGFEYRLTKTTLCTFPFATVARRSTIWQTVLLPPLSEPPVNVDRCNILDVEYFLVVKVYSSGKHGNFKLKTPVKFGVLPTVVSAFLKASAESVATPQLLPSAPPQENTESATNLTSDLFARCQANGAKSRPGSVERTSP